MQSLVGKQLKGLEREISRLSQLESRTACSRVTQPGPPATAASLLMVDKVRTYREGVSGTTQKGM